MRSPAETIKSELAFSLHGALGMNIDIALAPIEKLASVARSAAFGLFALAPAVSLVASIDLLDVIASNKTGWGLFLAVTAQWLFAIVAPGMMVALGLRLTLAARAVQRSGRSPRRSGRSPNATAYAFSSGK